MLVGKQDIPWLESIDKELDKFAQSSLIAYPVSYQTPNEPLQIFPCEISSKAFTYGGRTKIFLLVKHKADEGRNKRSLFWNMSQHSKSLLLAWDLGVCLKRRSANEKILSIQIEYDSKLQFLETPFFLFFWNCCSWALWRSIKFI